MNESEWIEYAAIHNPPEPTPSRSALLLSDPHLRAVYEIAVSVGHQQEGASGVALGLSLAVSGRPLRDDLDDIWDLETRIGYALGLQMVSDVTSRDGEMHGLDLDRAFDGQSISEWLTGWQHSVDKSEGAGDET